MITEKSGGAAEYHKGMLAGVFIVLGIVAVLFLLWVLGMTGMMRGMMGM